MWPGSFEERLVAWNHLRRHLANAPRERAAAEINDWWWQSPQIPHDINWSDIRTWPDPWQLLQRPAYSDLARALGIAYTMLMDDIFDARDLDVVHSRGYNLVVVDRGNYIWNYCPGELVNIATHPVDPQHSITGVELQQKTGIK